MNDAWEAGVEVPFIGRPRIDLTGARDRLGAEAVKLNFTDMGADFRQSLRTLEENRLNEAGLNFGDRHFAPIYAALPLQVKTGLTS